MRVNGRYWTAASAFALICSGVLAGDAQAQAQAAKSNTVGELVITAERRTENLQTAAISATVLDQELLEAKGVVGLTALQFAAPGLQISDYSSANTFNIRGIGQAQVDIDLPSGVVIYRDGVPTLTGYFQNAPYYDLASVEVLRGPQGTFVGKSAAAGAVFIRTQDPQLGDHVTGDVMLGGGNKTFIEGTLVANMPVSDTFAVRVALHSEHRDSLFDSLRSAPAPGARYAAGPLIGKGADDERHLYSARFGLRWKPNESFDAILKADYDYLDFGCHCTTGLVPTTGVEEDLDNPIVNGKHHYIDKGVRASLNLNYTFANGFLLKSLTGFSMVKTDADWDSNGSNPAPSGFESAGKFANYSQEFDILSPEDKRLRVVAGLFLQRYVNDIPEFPQSGFSLYTNDTAIPLINTPWKKNEKTIGIFSQGAFDITDALELQVGVRWTHYEFDQFTKLVLFPGLLNIPFNEPPGGVFQKLSENSVDWKVNLNYELSGTQFLYALVSRGHTPGSINIFSNPITPTRHTAYGEMEVINYEGGWKSILADGHLRTQIAAYYQTFEGYQAGFGFAAGGSIPQIATISEFKNAQTTSKIYGIEIGGQGVFGDLSLDFGAAYSKSKLGSFGIINNIFAPVYGGPAAIDIAGTTTPFAPKFSANFGVAYAFHVDSLKDGATLTPRIDVATKTHSYASLFHNRATLLEGVTLVNVGMRYEAGPWWGQLYATNLFDKSYPGAKQNVTGETGLIEGIVYRGPPRLFGIRIGRSF
jgi:iron complex outermembrane receptor protein